MNKITDMTTANLARIINKNQNIKCLKLSMSGLNERSVIEVLSSCKVLKQLVQVDLNFAHLSAPVSENGPHMYFSIDDIIQQIVIIEEEDPYNSIMEEINKQLTHFTLSNCSHKEMFSALAALSSLEHLDVNSSTIPFAAISSTIENNTSLKHINISNCSLCEHMFHIIAKAMSTLTQLGYLNISGIRVTKKAAGFVAATIAKNLAIYHFDVSKCQLQPNGLMKIVKSLMHLKNLSYLDISYSYFTAEAANELAYTFTQGVELEHLCLSNCNLYEQSFLAIVKSLASMTALRHLNLSNNIINSQTAFALSDCIANNSNIEYLDLSNCSLSENELRKVTASLKLLSSLKHLNFSSSVLNVHVVDDLAFAIGNNTGLEYINFSNCQVQKNGIFKILQKMLQTHTLKYINFQSNIIDTGQVDKKKSKNVITILVRIIVNNKSLEYVNFSSCGLSALDVTSIMKAQSVLSNLVYINISNNDVDTEAADEISSVIKSNKSLEVVDFSRCDMGVGSMSTVSNALSQCMHLRIVNLSNNVITREATKVLALSLCNIATLEHLDLSCCSLECSQFFATLSTSSSLHFKLKHINLSLNEIVCGASSYLASLLDDSGMTEYLDLSNCCLPTNDEEDGLYYILYVLKNSNYLKHLNLQSNKFTKTSACTLYNVLCINQELEYLNLDQCEVPEFFLGDILKQCRALKLLDISNSIVTDEAACVLSSVISSRVLEYLNMKDCILQKDGTEILVNAMALNTNMQYKVMEEETKHAIVGVVISNLTISMYRFDVTKYDPFAVNLNFGIIKPICYYKLTPHCISEKMCSLIVSAFSTEDVEYLNISHCELSDYNFHLIMQAIQHISSLKYFVHKSSTIQDDGLNNIVTVMYNCNSNVLHVDLSDCSISGSHISCVAKGLVTVQNLRYLNISSNEMTKEAVNDVASVITCCKTLEHFHANTCGIDDVGIEIICEALSTITSLLSFDISYNQIGNNCAGQIASVLYSNAKLEYLDFTNCFTENLFTVGPIKLKSIKSLSLENNLIDNNSAEIIKTALINNIMIENLILSHCNMTEEGLLLILSTLENVHSLKYINLGSNDFTKLIAEQMFSVLHANGNLWNIDLSDCKLSQIDLVAYVNLVILSEGSVIQHINFKHNNCDVGHDDSDLHEDECCFTVTSTEIKDDPLKVTGQESQLRSDK
ncbi:protein NLRC5-like [Dysidea avara]|uniref:protein NLRC5-like n=1 Tax=Dysidea avara TaxID=196820 RepID=UPI00331817B1